MPTEDLIPTLCTLCGVGCPVHYSPSKHRIARGGPELGCCPKGAAFASINGAKRPDRLTQFLIRKDGVLVPSSRDEAIHATARALLKVRKEQGPRALAVYSTGQLTLETLWVTKRLFQGYLGCNNVGANSEQCLVSNATAHEKVFGNEGSFTSWDDADTAQVIWLQGSNARETFPQFFRKKVMANKAAVKVVIDPFVSSTAKAVLAARDQKNVHVRFRSGGDVLFNTSIAGEIFRRGWEDRAYLEAFVDPASLDAFRSLALSQALEPEAVARRIALDGDDPSALAATIESMAHLWAHRRVVSHSSMGINQRTGVDGVASILNLHLIVGHVGRQGCGHLRVAGQSNAPNEVYLGYNSQLLPYRLRIPNADHRAKIEGIWRIPEGSIDPEPGTPISRYVQAPLGFLLVQGTDFANNFIDLFNWRWKLATGVFVVAIDCFMNESIEKFAHVVIPARSHAEISGTYARGDRRVQLLTPLFPAPDGTISDVEFIVRLQRTIAQLVWEGEDDLAGTPPIDPMLVESHTDGYFNMRGEMRSDLEAKLFEEAVKGAQDLGIYNLLTDHAGQSISHDRLGREGAIAWDGTRRYARDLEAPPPFPGHFRADKGRARLHVPGAETLAVRTLLERQVVLITGRGFLGTRDREGLSGVNLYNSGIKTKPITGPSIEADPYLYISETDASRWGIGHDDHVMIRAHGKAILRQVRVSPDAPPGHAFISFHSHGRLDNRVDSPNRLTTHDNVDPYSLQPRIKDLVVEIQKITPDEVAEYRRRLGVLAKHY